MNKVLLLLVLVVHSTIINAAEFIEGTHYKALSEQPTDSGNKIEVLEFFWYGCPHCYHFEPAISAWKKTKPENVEFFRVPAVFRPDWEVQARTYYALSSMGLIEDLHIKIFEAFHKHKKKLNSPGLMADFLEKNGVDRNKFLNEYNSFVVDSMTRKARKKQDAYQIEGVPSVAVNGKYLTSGSMAGSYEKLIDVINYLIDKESQK